MAIKSKKNWRPDEFAKAIAPFSPIIIAADTNPPSKAAKKLAAAFLCRLYYPSKSLTIRQKIKLAQKHKANSHERDALAAALKAYYDLAANKMRQLDRKYGERATVKVKGRVLSGQRTDQALK